MNKYDLLKINLDPNLVHILPEDYLQGRLDALKTNKPNNKSSRCKNNEHWVNNKRSTKGGYCRVNRGTESIPKNPASTGLKGLGGGLLLGSLGGASVATIIAASRTKNKVEAEIKQTDTVITSVKQEVNNSNNESKVEELNAKLKERENKINELQVEIDSRTKEIAAINEALNKKKANIERLEDESRKSSESSNKQIKEATQKIEQYEKQLKTQGEETKRAREELSSTKKEHIAEINGYQKQLSQKEVELGKLNDDLSKKQDEIRVLQNTLLVNPVTKKGGGSGIQDPSVVTAKVPLEGNVPDRSKLRQSINPDDIDWDNPKDREKANRSIKASVENAEERKEWIFGQEDKDKDKDSPPEKLNVPLADRAKDFIGDPSNQQSIGVKAAGTVGSVVGGMVAGPPGAILGGLLSGTLARQGIDYAQAFSEAQKKLKDSGLENEADFLVRLRKANIRTKEDLKNPKKRKSLENNLVKDNVTYLEGKGIEGLLEQIIETLNNG